jgi:hypothetical protein
MTIHYFFFHSAQLKPRSNLNYSLAAMKIRLFMTNISNAKQELKALKFS